MHERISVNSLCFLTTPIEEMAEYWRKLQPKRVSIIAPQLTAQTVDAVREAVSGYRLETVSGHRFMVSALTRDRDAWAEARDRLNSLIDLASQVNARSIYMLTGGHGSHTWEQAADIFAEAIAPCVQLAERKNVALAIENAPIVHADKHIGHTLRDTLKLAELSGIGVCADLFGCWTESDLRATIYRAVPRCEVVQVSDYVLGDQSFPCRAVPGDGAIPLERLLGWILEAGYEGCFDLELVGPRIDAEGRFAATERAAERLSDILKALGA